MTDDSSRVAIVDFGTGNLYNVRRACQHVGLNAQITSRPTEVLAADGVILPGVGAMPDAMQALRTTGLDQALLEVAARGTPLLGVCLGLQLLMTSGTEFTEHQGMGLFPGRVERLPQRSPDGTALRVPHIGWSAIRPTSALAWDSSPLETTPQGAHMYFVHSYHVIPESDTLVTATANHGVLRFVAAIRRDNVFACQFHPERSGAIGLGVYRAFAKSVQSLTVRKGSAE